MSTEAIQQQIVEAIASGKINPTTIIIGDQIQTQHRIEKVEAGGIGIQIVAKDATINTEQPTTAKNVQTTCNLCPYIQVSKLAEVGTYTPEQFNAMMSKEAEQTASQFAKFLNRHTKTGYLNFGQHSKRQIYHTLHEFFPTMKQYSYSNFALYF